MDMECREEENLLPKDGHDGVSKRSFKDMPTHEIMSAIQDLKQFVQEKVEDLNVRVERRLRKMENDIAAVVAHSSEAKQASHQGTLGRDESKLALESDRQTMEKHRKDHENMSQEEQKRVAAEAERQQAELLRISLSSEMRTFLQAAKSLKSQRTELDTPWQETEHGRKNSISQMCVDLARFRGEHDSMLDGFDEVKQLIKSSNERLEESLKKSENDLYLELNKVRSQVFEAITKRNLDTPVVCSALPGATVADPNRKICLDSPRGSRAAFQLPTSMNAFNIADSDVDNDDGGIGMRGRTALRSRADPHNVEAMPYDGKHGLCSPLIQRLRLKRCVLDNSVPGLVRCTTVVVGKVCPIESVSLCD
jgi:hypothetical protein